MWQTGPPFLPLPPPVSYTKWTDRSSRKSCLLNYRYIVELFIFYSIRNIIWVKTPKDCLHWESQYGRGQIKLSTEWKEGSWGHCLYQRHSSSCREFISPPFEHLPKTHTCFCLSPPGIQRCLDNIPSKCHQMSSIISKSLKSNTAVQGGEKLFQNISSQWISSALA